MTVSREMRRALTINQPLLTLSLLCRTREFTSSCAETLTVFKEECRTIQRAIPLRPEVGKVIAAESLGDSSALAVSSVDIGDSGNDSGEHGADILIAGAETGVEQFRG